MDVQITVLPLLLLLLLVTSWYLAPLAWARLLLATARKAAGLRSRETTVDGIRWHYLDGGDGPALVAVHGFGGDADHWLQVGFSLTRRFRVVAPDLPGFGTSETRDDLPFDIPSQSARLREFLDHLGIEECILVGSSMGGWVSTQLAAADPGRVRMLWLLAPLGVEECRQSELLAVVDAGVGSPMEISSPAEFQQRVIRPMFHRHPWIPYPLKALYGRRAVRRSRAAERMFRQVRASPESLESLAASVTAPVLLQWGAEDRVVDVSGLAPLQSAFANCEARLQEKTGHLPMLEKPGASLRLFDEFYRRHPPGAGHRA